nr:hypothetical protein [Desulfuromonadales bacterium]
MKNNTLSVGGYVDSQCTKCKRATNHIIVAMVEDQVARVECCTCSGVHNYRPPKAEKPAAPKTPKGRRSTAASRKAAQVAEEIEAV